MKNELVQSYGFEIEEVLIQYISEHFDEKQSFYLGNGIRVLVLDKTDNLEQKVFPVFCNENLLFLVLYDNEPYFFSDSEVLTSINEDKNFVIVKAEGNVYLIFKNKVFVLYENNEEVSQKTKDRIESIKNGSIEENLMGIEKRAIRISSEQEKQPVINEMKYHNDRILIRFASEKIENKIRMYEAFCHGRVEESASDDNTYVFCFEPLNSENLGILLDASKGLSYVLDASLIEKTEESKPVAEIDFSQPVTEKEPLDLP